MFPCRDLNLELIFNDCLPNELGQIGSSSIEEICLNNCCHEHHHTRYSKHNTEKINVIYGFCDIGNDKDLQNKFYTVSVRIHPNINIIEMCLLVHYTQNFSE